MTSLTSGKTGLGYLGWPKPVSAARGRLDVDAPPHQVKPIEVVQTSGEDGSWTSLSGYFRYVQPGGGPEQTQDMLKKLHLGWLLNSSVLAPRKTGGGG